MKTLVTESGVQTQQNRVPCLHAKTDPAVLLHISKTNQTGTREHVARIDKKRHVESGGYLPAVLAAEKECIVIVEPVLQESAQIVASAQRRLHIKRHRISFLGIAELGSRAQCEDAFPIEEWQVMFNLRVEASEGIGRKLVI